MISTCLTGLSAKLPDFWISTEPPGTFVPRSVTRLSGARWTHPRTHTGAAQQEFQSYFRNSAQSGLSEVEHVCDWPCETSGALPLGKMLGGAHHCHLLVTLPLALTSHCPTLITTSFCLPQILNRKPLDVLCIPGGPEMSRSWKVMESRHAVLSLKHQSAGWAPCAMWDVCLLYGFVIQLILKLHM